MSIAIVIARHSSGGSRALWPVPSLQQLSGMSIDVYCCLYSSLTDMQCNLGPRTVTVQSHVQHTTVEFVMIWLYMYSWQYHDNDISSHVSVCTAKVLVDIYRRRQEGAMKRVIASNVMHRHLRHPRPWPAYMVIFYIDSIYIYMHHDESSH